MNCATVAAGFHIKRQYNIFYAFSNYSDLGGTHRIGFSYRFDFISKTKSSKLLYDSSQPVGNVPPENLKVNIDSEKLSISWGRVVGVRYNVYAKHSSINKWMKLNKTPLYNNSLNYKQPVALGVYFFKVCSVYNDEESSFSKEVSLNVK